MIVHSGVRTTEPIEVMFKELKPGEDENKAIQELLGQISGDTEYSLPRYDHSILVYYESPINPHARREIMIPISKKYKDIKTKIHPSIRAAFVVYRGTDSPHETYYKLLEDYIEKQNLEKYKDIYSIEIIYVPEDLDFVDYTIEIMLPVKKE